jgi:hypothetical protein
MKAGERKKRLSKSSNKIRQPTPRGFTDDVIITIGTHIQVRGILKA